MKAFGYFVAAIWLSVFVAWLFLILTFGEGDTVSLAVLLAVMVLIPAILLAVFVYALESSRDGAPPALVESVAMEPTFIRTCPLCKYDRLRCYADQRRRIRRSPSSTVWCRCGECGILLRNGHGGDGTYVEVSRHEWSKGVGL